MRKLWTAVLALVTALAFLIVGSPPASALGGEVLGCSVDFDWTAGSCQGIRHNSGTLNLVDFQVRNTSGTYGSSWSITIGTTPVTTTCVSTFASTPCLAGGSECTAGSLSCQVYARVGDGNQTFVATVVLSQSGQSETLTATATVKGSLDGGGGCAKC
jgi:hypothetical protein